MEHTKWDDLAAEWEAVGSREDVSDVVFRAVGELLRDRAERANRAWARGMDPKPDARSFFLVMSGWRSKLTSETGVTKFGELLFEDQDDAVRASLLLATSRANATRSKVETLWDRAGYTCVHVVTGLSVKTIDRIEEFRVVELRVATRSQEPVCEAAGDSG